MQSARAKILAATLAALGGTLTTMPATADSSVGVAANAPTDARRGVLSYADLLTPALESVIQLKVGKPRKVPAAVANDEFMQRFFEKPEEPGEDLHEERGSGFVIDAAQGLIVTTSFLLEDAEKTRVTLPDGRVLPATVVGIDEESQIGLLRVPPDRLTSATWGDSEALRVGDVVFAVGHPYSLGRTVTAGIVSGLQDAIEEYAGLLIVSDATIARGHAGGPLLDSRGRVVGVCFAILTRTNDLQLSFAVPATDAKLVVAELLAHGTVRRGLIGVQVDESFADEDFSDGLQVQPAGVKISGVTAGSSAERAGLKANDVVVSAAGQPVRSAAVLRRIVHRAGIGATLDLTIRRAGAEQRVSVTVMPGRD